MDSAAKRAARIRSLCRRKHDGHEGWSRRAFQARLRPFHLENRARCLPHDPHKGAMMAPQMASLIAAKAPGCWQRMSYEPQLQISSKPRRFWLNSSRTISKAPANSNSRSLLQSLL